MKATTKPLTALVLLAGMGLASTSEAALIERLGGLAVYDTDLNITWLANANGNGQMHWSDANAWATGLNVDGYTGWRLPTADPPCGANFNCTGSELGHLYYTELGVTQKNKITSSTSPYLQLFTNVKDSVYWTSTGHAPPLTSTAWTFNTAVGFQDYIFQSNDGYAWAVRSGDIAVPEPGVMWLIGAGALAWAGTGARRKAARVI